MKRFITVFIFMAIGQFAMCQNQSQASSDLSLPLPYDPGAIMEEWVTYTEQPTQEKAFIKSFMIEHEVPQTPLYGLDQKGTWYWWISNNPEPIQKYLELKAESEN